MEMGGERMEQSKVTYSVVLADDEPIILRSLKAAIPWEELGLRVVGEARNGEEAQQVVSEVKPHIVISDIRMPTIDGITLMKQVMTEHPGLIFIFISGYGEFDYAREALRQGAFDYMLKPIDHDELTEILVKARERLDGERQRQLESERLMHSVQALSLLARERMFAEMIEGNQKPLQHLQWLENSELNQTYFMMIVQLEHYEAMNRQWTAEEKRLWFFAIRNILEEWSGQNGGLTVFPFRSGEWVLLFQKDSRERKLRLGEEMLRTIRSNSKLACSVGISPEAYGLEQLSQAYEGALQALHQRFYSGGEGVFIEEEPRGAQDGQSDVKGRYPKHLESQLAESVRTLDVERLGALFGQLKSYIEQEGFSAEIARRFIVQLAVILDQQLEYVHAPHGGGSMEELLQQLEEAATLDELIGQARASFAGRIMARSTQQSREDGHSAIEKAKKYIANHYHKDLGIEEVSELVDLSASHFCTLFKQVSGYTFLEYLTQCRIEKAKYILKHSDVKVYQVAPLVGYQDPKYFTQVFKRVMAMTPSEYRERA